MREFRMTAETPPKNAEQWFPAFNEGSEFAAENKESAQDWLNRQCTLAGTDSDPRYDDHGPYAEPL